MKKLCALILIFCFSYGGTIRIEGNQTNGAPYTSGYPDDSGYVIDGVQSNGSVPNFDSYLVLGNIDDYGVSGNNRRGGATYYISGLPSSEEQDYVSIELEYYVYTSDLDYSNAILDVQYLDTVVTTNQVSFSDASDYYTRNHNVIHYIGSHGSGGRLYFNLESNHEIAIDYVAVNYSVKHRLELENTTWNNNIEYTGDTYQVELSNNDPAKTVNWSTSGIPDWVSLDLASGSNLTNGTAQTINITVSENTSEENSRTCTINFYNTSISEDSVAITLTQDAAPPRSSIRGRITNNSGNVGIANIRMLLSFSESGSSYELIDSTLTDNDGLYSFQDLLYGSYKITPRYADHEFDPTQRTITLSESEQIADFTDQTSLYVGGMINFAGFDCPIKDVVIMKQIPDVAAVEFALSDSTGHWSGSVGIGEQFRLVPQKGGLTFSPDAYPASGFTYLLEDNNSIDFDVTTTKALTLKAQKNNGDPIENVNMIIRSTSGCIPETTAVTDNTGEVTLNLPPLSYEIHANSSIYLGWYPDDMIEIDLSQDTTCIFNPITDIVLKILDMPYVYNADSTDSIFAIHQEDTASIRIEARDTDGYPVSSATIDITDLVASTDGAALISTVTADTNGIAEYCLVGGEPEYHSEDHLKSIKFSAMRDPYTENEQNTQTWEIAVTGEKLVTEAFTTGLPEIPLKILHDPSGDNSYSYFIEESKLTQSIGLSIESSVGEEIKAKTGFKIFGIGTSVSGTINTSLSLSSNTAWDITFSEKDVKSSSKISNYAPSIGPGKGDVYVGLGMNILYGLGEVVDIDDAVPYLDTNFFWQPNLNAATYMYTANYIENEILKGECDRLPFYQNEDWLYDPVDSRERWENVLHMNIGYDNMISEDERSLVREIQTLSFNGGTSADHDYSVTRSMRTTLNTSMKLNSEIATALELGALETSYTVKISMGVGTSFSLSETNTETIGYHLQDDDEYDALNIKCYQDLVFGTLLFISENSVTSNPWERQTSCLMGVEVNPAGDVSAGLRTNETATFWADVCNTNFNPNVPGYYTVYVPSNLNPTHATVRINGKKDDNILVPHGSSCEVGISAEYDVSTIGDTSTFAIVAQALNDWQIADTLYYTIYWDHVVPLVDFMTGNDPFGNALLDTIKDLSRPLMIWGEPQSGEDPDSVILYSRLSGNYIWDRVGKMEEIQSTGTSHNYYRYEYLADSESDSCCMEFEMTAYKNDKTRNSKDRYDVYIYPTDISGIAGDDLPDEFTLSQNYPNPFNPVTTISYAVPEPAGVRLSIYDISGALVRIVIEEDHAPGVYDIHIDASAYPSGLYIYRLEANGHVLSKKMLLMK